MTPGEAVINAVIRAGAIEDCHKEAASNLFVWAANAPEQIEAALRDQTVRMKFQDLPLGTRFRYLGGDATVWVLLDRSGHGLVARYERLDGWVAGQSICSAFETIGETRQSEVLALIY